MCLRNHVMHFIILLCLNVLCLFNVEAWLQLSVVIPTNMSLLCGLLWLYSLLLPYPYHHPICTQSWLIKTAIFTLKTSEPLSTSSMILKIEVGIQSPISLQLAQLCSGALVNGYIYSRRLWTTEKLILQISNWYALSFLWILVPDQLVKICACFTWFICHNSTFFYHGRLQILHMIILHNYVLYYLYLIELKTLLLEICHV